MKIEISKRVIEKAIHAHDNGKNCFACPLVGVPGSICYAELQHNAQKHGIFMETEGKGSNE